MEPFRLEAVAVVEPLDKLLIATGNKLEREWPPFVPCHDSSPVYLRSFVAIGRNIFRAMQYFCADKPPDPDRRLEYSLAAAPLARVVLELPIQPRPEVIGVVAVFVRAPRSRPCSFAFVTTVLIRIQGRA